MFDSSLVESISGLAQRAERAESSRIEKIDDRLCHVDNTGITEILFEKQDPTIRYPRILDLFSLAGLVDYCMCNKDDVDKDTHFISIVSARQVHVYRDKDANSYRHHAATASTGILDIKEVFQNYDGFVAYVLKYFAVDDMVAKLLDVASRVKAENSAETEDTGVSQTVHIKAGAATTSKEKLTNPVYLSPITLFPEVEPIPQPHIFRIQNTEQGTHFTLKCVAASNWDALVAERYAEYLKVQLPGWRVLR